MDNEIQLISDGSGVAVIGDPTAVERFLVSEGLPSTDLGLHRLGAVLNAGAAAAQTGSELASNSGRWVKLSKESARAIDKYGLRTSSKSGLSTGVLKGNKGQIKGFVEFTSKPGAILTNPALLAGAAGIMAQLAMQQTMEEITDYLAAIDEKVDDVLRAQKDSVLASMIGAGFVIEEAMTIRDQRGRVDEITWSKVQTMPGTIAETQAYALRQLDALAEKMEKRSKVSDLAEVAKDAEAKAQEWLAVLARCFGLQDAIAVLELDRVLDASPDELDGHRLGLEKARKNRLDLISQCTARLMARMDAAADTANTKVLLNPTKAPGLVQSSNHVSNVILEFHERLGITHDRESLEAKRWTEAATEVRDRALETGADKIEATRRLGAETFGRAMSTTGRLSDRVAERARRLRSTSEDNDD
ncbi:hypothetical protein ACIO3S_09240 [Nocardioides sp. NPDC087217]|uniref:hypothetical protein n=1 Tax=Nocardioides sp. NPDC087217 TaxID=3364335 RepID=UPI00382B3352